jgi:hypothetical protein
MLTENTPKRLRQLCTECGLPINERHAFIGTGRGPVHQNCNLASLVATHESRGEIKRVKRVLYRLVPVDLIKEPTGGVTVEIDHEKAEQTNHVFGTATQAERFAMESIDKAIRPPRIDM